MLPGSHSPFKAFENIWSVTSDIVFPPNTHGVRTKGGGFFGAEMRQRSPCFSVRAADPQLKALSRFSV